LAAYRHTAGHEAEAIEAVDGADHRRADRAQRRSHICIPSRYSGLVAARHRASQKDAMRAGETELQMCVRHVAEQENRVARQDVLVERLRENGSHLLDDALRLLAEMHHLLETMREHVARLDPR
jgi:hypothetical protein